MSNLTLLGQTVPYGHTCGDMPNNWALASLLSRSLKVVRVTRFDRVDMTSCYIVRHNDAR